MALLVSLRSKKVVAPIPQLGDGTVGPGLVRELDSHLQCDDRPRKDGRPRLMAAISGYLLSPADHHILLSSPNKDKDKYKWKDKYKGKFRDKGDYSHMFFSLFLLLPDSGLSPEDASPSQARPPGEFWELVLCSFYHSFSSWRGVVQ